MKESNKIKTKTKPRVKLTRTDSSLISLLCCGSSRFAPLAGLFWTAEAHLDTTGTLRGFNKIIFVAFVSTNHGGSSL